MEALQGEDGAPEDRQGGKTNSICFNLALTPGISSHQMPVLSLANIEKTFGPRVLFDHLSFSMEKGERVGFIGANGAGKTSLLKLLTGELRADAGEVSIARSIKLGML